jgi:hypothetical protein
MVPQVFDATEAQATLTTSFDYNQSVRAPECPRTDSYSAGLR